MPSREEMIAFIKSKQAASPDAVAPVAPPAAQPVAADGSPSAAPSGGMSRADKIAFIQAQQAKASQPKPERGVGETLVRGAIDNILPVAGALGGAAIAGSGTLGAGTLLGGGLGFAAGKQAARAAEHYIYGDDDGAKNMGDVVKRNIDDVGTGMTYEVGGKLVGAGANALVKGAGKVLVPALEEGTTLVPKPNQAEIIEAAKRMGIKPTPGMLYDNPVVAGLESSLSQSPSLGGMMVRRSTKPIVDTIDDTIASTLKDSTGSSPFQSGQQVKAGIEKSVGERLAPSREVYEELAKATPHMEVDPKSLERVGKNIKSLDGATLMPGSAGAQKAEQYASWIQNAKTVDQLKTIRQALGKDLGAAEGPEKSILADMYERISRLEQNSMMRSAVNTMRDFAQKPSGKTGEVLAAEGEQIGKDMVGKLKGANKDYSGAMNDLNEVTSSAGLRDVHSPEHFLSKINGLDSERVADTLYSPADYRMMQVMQKNFPKEAELLRQAQLANIESKASVADGGVSVPKFLNQTNKLGDEAKIALFGPEGVSKIADTKTIVGSLPEKIGKSGTPQGKEYLDMLNPLKQGADLGRYAVYKGLTKFGTVEAGDVAAAKSASKIAEKLLQDPEMAKVAAESPGAFKGIVLQMANHAAESGPNSSAALRSAAQNKAPSELDKDSSVPASYKVQPKDGAANDMPKKGPAKWANDGHAALMEHASDDETKQALADAKPNLMADAKAKDLLSQASDLKPGSKAMEQVLSKVKARMKASS